MKHRRIVSDTSALHLPMSLMQQQLPQQQHGTLMRPLAADHHAAGTLKQYVYADVNCQSVNNS